MRFFGTVIARIALICVGRKWADLQRRLHAVHNAYWAQTRQRIPGTLTRALIAAEDHRFYRHCGVDLVAIFGAAWRYVRLGKLSGASTINQQLVRVLTGRYDRNLKRKVNEILLALLVSRIIPKADIPGLYLSVAYFGSHMNGIEQACERLGSALPAVTQRQAALLVARIKYPEPEHPSSDRVRQIERRASHIMKLVQRHNSLLQVGPEAEADAAIPSF